MVYCGFGFLVWGVRIERLGFKGLGWFRVRHFSAYLSSIVGEPKVNYIGFIEHQNN